MYDPTPPPYGTITRRWTLLSDAERDRHAYRLLGVSYRQARITQPEGADHYRRLVEAVRAGDLHAFAWLATSHRPLLLRRGQRLRAEDPAEWGAVCLELLYTVLQRTPLDEDQWLRRNVSRRLSQYLGERSRRHFARREQTTDPAVLDRLLEAPEVFDAVPSAPCPPQRRGGRAVGSQPVRLVATGTTARGSRMADPGEMDLGTALGVALARLDEPTREALRAIADGRTITSVAEQHALTPAALWQRVHRARQRLRPELAAFRRGV